MGCCTAHCFLLSLCVVQLIVTVVREVFNFLAPLWLPILLDFLHVIFVIFGFFGVYQYRPRYLIGYAVWLIVWIAWNTFVICLYLDIGVLNKESGMLNLGTGLVSWWETGGPGCHSVYPINMTLSDPFRPAKVEGCLIDYHYIEAAQAALQTFLAVLGLSVTACVLRNYTEEDDNSHTKSRNTSLYSIEISSQRDRTTPSPLPDDDQSPDNIDSFIRPMTPRRVKRRSLRGSTRSSSSRSSRHRNSGRNRHGHYVNPMLRLMDQGGDSSTSNDSAYLHTSVPMGKIGLSNPLYQSSMQSLAMDLELRPPSAHSSYSNYHGQRPVSIHAHGGALPNHYPTPSVPVQAVNHSVPYQNRAVGQVASSIAPGRPPRSSETVI